MNGKDAKFILVDDLTGPVGMSGPEGADGCDLNELTMKDATDRMIMQMEFPEPNGDTVEWTSALVPAARRIARNGSMELWLREGYVDGQRYRWTINDAGIMEDTRYIIMENEKQIGGGNDDRVLCEMLSTHVNAKLKRGRPRPIDEALAAGAFKVKPPMPDEYGDW